MDNLKLAVCIPTYNRPDHIKRQVRDVIKQLVPGVRLIVLDNHSPIPVESLFSEEELSQFLIIRHHVNIGGDANNVRCLELAEDGWVWLLSDDDTIRPDAISVVLNLINQHRDCCFINTGNKKTIELSTFDDFLSYFKIRGTWGKAFFQSACLFNMSVMKDSLIWYYNFLSSQIGQLCMVIKHMELNEGAKVFFTSESLITGKEPGGWDPMKLVINSSCIIDKFQYCKKRMRPTVFYSLGNMYLDSISSLKKGRLKYLRFINNKLGFFNILRYNYIGVAYYMMARIMPSNYRVKLHEYVAKRYLERVK